MKFYHVSGTELSAEALNADYEGAREIGRVHVGDSALFFRKLRKTYYIAHADITRCFRRVLKVEMKMCCGGGEMAVERLIVCNAQGELAEVPLPDTRSARAVMEELAKRAPMIAQGVNAKA